MAVGDDVLYINRGDIMGKAVPNAVNDRFDFKKAVRLIAQYGYDDITLADIENESGMIINLTKNEIFDRCCKYWEDMAGRKAFCDYNLIKDVETIIMTCVSEKEKVRDMCLRLKNGRMNYINSLFLKDGRRAGKFEQFAGQMVTLFSLSFTYVKNNSSKYRKEVN